MPREQWRHSRSCPACHGTGLATHCAPGEVWYEDCEAMLTERENRAERRMLRVLDAIDGPVPDGQTKAAQVQRALGGGDAA